jgi:hypothetical protein
VALLVVDDDCGENAALLAGLVVVDLDDLNRPAVR